MSFIDLVRKRPKAAFAAALGAAATLYAAQNHVGPDQFALRQTFGIVADKVEPSGIYLHIPFVQYTHSYQENTQKISFNAGSCRFFPMCNSTEDQNAVTSSVSLHFRVLKDTKKLGFHKWSMDGWIMPDGYWLLTELLNDSANAVMGKSPMAGTVGNPEEYLKRLHEDFTQRIESNNVPIEITALELHGFNTSMMPTRTNSYRSVGNLNTGPVR